MSAWDPLLYLRYGDERGRAAHDLLARVPIDQASLVYDLGCGPGNSTELLVNGFRMPRSSGSIVRKRCSGAPALSFRTSISVPPICANGGPNGRQIAICQCCLPMDS